MLLVLFTYRIWLVVLAHQVSILVGQLFIDVELEAEHRLGRSELCQWEIPRTLEHDRIGFSEQAGASLASFCESGADIS